MGFQVLIHSNNIVVITQALACGLDHLYQFKVAITIENYEEVFPMAALVGLFGTYLLAKTPASTIEITNKKLREYYHSIQKLKF